MRKFYCPSEDIQDNQIIISEKSKVHHLRTVLRLKADDELLVFDERENTYRCIIKAIAKNVTLQIRNKEKAKKAAECLEITVACAIQKKARFDEIIDKLTQLGVGKIIPLLTERVIVRLDREDADPRLERWKRIALAASQQSQRSALPVIEPPTSLKGLLVEAKEYDLRLIATLGKVQKTLRQALAHKNPKRIIVLIGPEGDFTKAELALAKEAGFLAVSLGDLVLRVETAAVAVASFLKLYEDS